MLSYNLEYSLFNEVQSLAQILEMVRRVQIRPKNSCVTHSRLLKKVVWQKKLSIKSKSSMKQDPSLQFGLVMTSILYSENHCFPCVYQNRPVQFF